MYFQQGIEKWISRCADDTKRLWKITEYCRRVRKCKKKSLIIARNIGIQFEEVWSIGNQMSVDMERYCRIWIS